MGALVRARRFALGRAVDYVKPARCGPPPTAHQGLGTSVGAAIEVELAVDAPKAATLYDDGGWTSAERQHGQSRCGRGIQPRSRSAVQSMGGNGLTSEWAAWQR